MEDAKEKKLEKDQEIVKPAERKGDELPEKE